MATNTTMRFYGTKLADCTERLLGYRVIAAEIIKRKGRPIKVIREFRADKNQ